MEEVEAAMLSAGSEMLPSRGNGVTESSVLEATAYAPSHAPAAVSRGLRPAASTTNGSSSATALPDDVLTDILRRLPPRGLAISRCVCQSWRAAVDGGRLLRADLLPHSVRGLVLMYHDLDFPAFLSRPSPDDIDILAGASPNPDPGGRSFVTVVEHCNGQLLLRDRRGFAVSNPATRRSARLPPPPRFGRLWYGIARLVFDPAADSPHYAVFLVPESRRIEKMDMKLRGHQVREDDDIVPHQEWPPSTWFLCVFSSLTGKWEERLFAMEGELPETASDKEDSVWSGSGAFWRGALYAQCHSGAASVVR